MTKTIFRKIVLEVYFCIVILTEITFIYMERAGFMTCTAASHQGAIKEPTASLFKDEWDTPDMNMRTVEVESAWESTCINAIPPVPPLIDNELWQPGKTGHLVTQSLTFRVLRPLFQIASLRFGSLSVHCSCHTETRCKLPFSNDRDTHFERQDSQLSL